MHKRRHKYERRMAKSGLPVDLLLGPLVFLIYIDDIKSQLTVMIAFLLMKVPFTDQYILKVIPLPYKKIYLSCRGGQIHGKWHLMLINVSYSV